jgi:ribonuclease HI
LYNGSQECIWSGGKYLGTQTNNVAEYNGLIMGLEAAADLELDALEIRGDSRLVINQVFDN